MPEVVIVETTRLSTGVIKGVKSVQPEIKNVPSMFRYSR